jgi:hypothetical protein
MDITFHVVPRCPAYEYFCRTCLQLRLSCAALGECGNCGSNLLIKGAVGSLNKPELQQQYQFGDFGERKS